jgi:hypothetical protein
LRRSIILTNTLYVGSNRDIYQKYKIGDIDKGVDNALYPGKKFTKETFYFVFCDNVPTLLTGVETFLFKVSLLRLSVSETARYYDLII